MALIYANRSQADIAFKDDFDAIEKECAGSFRVVHVLSQPEDGWRGHHGHISAKIIQDEIPDFREKRFYICGPPLMVSGMKYILINELKIADDSITFENFTGY